MFGMSTCRGPCIERQECCAATPRGESCVRGGRGGLYQPPGAARAALLRSLTVRFLGRVITQVIMQSSLVCLLVLVAAAAAAPQREGAAFSKEAIKQAQNTFLIPKDAEIQKVQEGIELAAYESIPGNQRINLFEILGDQVPSEVINNLQGQIDQVGRN
ncbi:hypothetical protein MSG28_003745 [Choristoneura fumiferana]|uniref:Uncharacterized protein n=1 Tax=Choristoneura fumiferana TaxID=7141 RepID=A0ACC0KG10_CHOFU|nr:hypothetical protein MSG28_003745 [Choristoneura fumiferana]